MRPPSLRALYWNKYLKRGGKREKGISSELLDLWNIKGIEAKSSLPINLKPYQLSAHLPRCAPCRAFRKEVLKGETAQALLKKASKRNKKLYSRTAVSCLRPCHGSHPEGKYLFLNFYSKPLYCCYRILNWPSLSFPVLKKEGFCLLCRLRSKVRAPAARADDDWLFHWNEKINRYLPSSPRFIPHCGRFGDDAARAMPTKSFIETKIINNYGAVWASVEHKKSN